MAFTPEDWQKRLRRDWELLRLNYKREFGKHFGGYFKVYEVTKQGCPHIHAVLMLEEETPGLEDWFKRTWQGITGDSTYQHGADLKLMDGRGNKLPKDAVNYCCKYLMKDTDDTLGWNKYRHYNRSRDFPIADLGELEAFLLIGGEMFNRAEYKRDYGYFYQKLNKYLGEANYDPEKYKQEFEKISKGKDAKRFKQFEYIQKNRLREYKTRKADAKRELRPGEV